jgi:hypothetical protein
MNTVHCIVQCKCQDGSNLTEQSSPHIITLCCQVSQAHRLNMELDLQSLFGLHVHSCSHCLRPCNSPPPNAFGLILVGAIGQHAR